MAIVKLTPKARRRFEKLWLDTSVRIVEIAAIFDVSPPTTIRWRKEMDLPSRGQLSGLGRYSHPTKTTRRACLKCRCKFTSDGAGHRICGVCKKAKVWRIGLGFAEDYSVNRGTET